jgi:hypothetical protein
MHSFAARRQRSVVRSHVSKEILDMVTMMNARLDEQAEQVRSLEADAEASATNVRAGNDELRKLRTGPSTLRNFAVSFALGLAALLLFLHWFNP